jgi:hypothetical protein
MQGLKSTQAKKGYILERQLKINLRESSLESSKHTQNFRPKLSLVLSVSKRALQWYSVTKTFTFKGVQTTHRSKMVRQ